MRYTHIQKNIASSPRKLRLVADMVRKMTPVQALQTLEYTQKAAATPLAKAIKTAIANAGRDDVVFEKIEINEGMKLKRNRVGTAGRGRSRPYVRRWSQIRIVLNDEVQKNSENSAIQRVSKSDKSEMIDKQSNSESSEKKEVKVKERKESLV